MQEILSPELLAQLDGALPDRDDVASVHSHPALFRAIFDRLADAIEAGSDTADGDTPIEPRQP